MNFKNLIFATFTFWFFVTPISAQSFTHVADTTETEVVVIDTTYQDTTAATKLVRPKKIKRKKNFLSYFSNKEYGVMMGAMTYAGDLADDHLGTHVEISEVNLGIGLVQRFVINNRFALRVNALFGRISGSDGNAVSESRINRNLDFRTWIGEGSVQAEFNLFNGKHLFKGKHLMGLSSPYVFAGVGGFYFNPQGTDETGRWVDLYPLGTEGQYQKGSTQKMYHRVQLSIPFGAGFRYAFNEYTNVGFELGFRKTFTDYLDDVSGTYANPEGFTEPLAKAMASKMKSSGNPVGQIRGNPDGKDWYIFAGLTVTTALNRSGPRPVKKWAWSDF